MTPGMEAIFDIKSVLAVLCLLTWGYLFLAHGRFWVSGPELPPANPAEPPDVDIIVPARDEAQTIQPVMASLLAQSYAGRFRVILVDDSSSDATVALAGAAANLLILRAPAKPPGWSGKLWAVNQGVAASSAPVLLLTDADIVHDPRHLTSLVARLERPRAQMVSEMVKLNCTSFAERMLVPAFVYFFQMLYPFTRVNEQRSRTAAAAGGTMLIRREALQAIGGLAAIREALIDDVALAKALKRTGPIYLGHSALATSIRTYPGTADIWRMVSRTAFTQLRHSGCLLALTLLGLAIVWWAPVAMAVLGRGWQRDCGVAACALAVISYMPTLVRYGRARLWAITLPLIALFYMGATLDSAIQFWRGRGASWKSRAYGASH